MSILERGVKMNIQLEDTNKIFKIDLCSYQLTNLIKTKKTQSQPSSFSDFFTDIKQISDKDQSFYSGHLKINFVDRHYYDNFPNLKKDTILHLKPNFIICIFEEMSSNTECEVFCMGKKIQVKIIDLLMVKLPVYRKE